MICSYEKNRLEHEAFLNSFLGTPSEEPQEPTEAVELNEQEYKDRYLSDYLFTNDDVYSKAAVKTFDDIKKDY